MKENKFLWFTLAAVAAWGLYETGTYVFNHISALLGIFIYTGLFMAAVYFFYKMFGSKSVNAIALAVLVSGCTTIRPEYEGIIMTNCGKNGIKDFKVETGRVNAIGVCTEVYRIPMGVQRGEVGDDVDDVLDLTLARGATGFTVDPIYSYRAIRGRGPQIAFENPGSRSVGGQFLENIEEAILDPLVYNTYREHARNYTPDSLLQYQNQYEQSVEDTLAAAFEKRGFHLEILTANITPPKKLNQQNQDRDVEIAQYNKQVEERARVLEIMQLDMEIEADSLTLQKLKTATALERSRGLTPQILRAMEIEAWSDAGGPVPEGYIPVGGSVIAVPGKK